MSKRVVLLAVTAALLALPAGANAGGWATVELNSVPYGMDPGDTWNVQMKILQHGVTPLEGADPRVIVQKKGEGKQAFPASATKDPGVYAARVVFDSPGTWDYRIAYQIYDGLDSVQTYAPVTIGAGGEDAAASEAQGVAPAGGGGGGADAAPAAAASSDSGPDIALALAVAAVAGLVAAFAAAAFRRRREGPAAA